MTALKQWMDVFVKTAKDKIKENMNSDVSSVADVHWFICQELCEEFGLWEKEEDNIYEKVNSLVQTEKTRKTIVISGNIGQELDQFSERMNLNKSDVIHLALRELFDKYEKTPEK
jgi:metallophosphoesterase superfamily enzyme